VGIGHSCSKISKPERAWAGVLGVVVGAVRRRTAQAVMVLVLTGIVAAYTVVNWPQR
jgi:hypothetical protein